MAVYEYKSGKLDLVMVAGDDFSLPLTISGNRSAYTFSAYLEAMDQAATYAQLRAVIREALS